MNRKFLIMAILTIFLVGTVCAFACEPVNAKPIVKVKKENNHFKAKFKYKGHKYTAKLKKNKKMTKYYDDKVYDTTKKKGGRLFRLYHSTYSDGWGKVGWNFCKLREGSWDSHLYYKIKWV